MAVLDSDLSIIASNDDFRRLIPNAVIGTRMLDVEESWRLPAFDAALHNVLDRQEAFFDIALLFASPLFVSGRSLQTNTGPPPPLVVLAFTTVTSASAPKASWQTIRCWRRRSSPLRAT